LRKSWEIIPILYYLETRLNTTDAGVQNRWILKNYLE